MLNNEPMRFLIAVLDTGTNTAVPGEMQAIDAFNDMLQANGHFIQACGVDSPATATVIDNRGGLGQVTDGPLHNLSEYMSGFWLIKADSLELAKELAAAGSLACNRKVEVRPLLGN